MTTGVCSPTGLQTWYRDARRASGHRDCLVRLPRVKGELRRLTLELNVAYWAELSATSATTHTGAGERRRLVSAVDSDDAF